MSNENPWIIEPLRKLEPVSENTEESDQAESEKERTEIASRLINQYMPEDPEKEFLDSLAERGIKIDELTDDKERGRIENIRLKCRREKEELAKEFVGFAIPTEDLEQYTVEIMSFEGEVAEYEPQMKSFSHKESRASDLTARFDSLEKIQFWRHLFDEWKPVIEKEKDALSKKYKKNEFFGIFAKEMTGYNIWPKQPERDEKEIAKQFEVYKEIKTFLADLPDELKELPWEKDFVRAFREDFFTMAVDYHDPEQAHIYFQLFKDCLVDKDPEVATKYLAAIGQYGRNHSLSRQSIASFETKLFPAVENKDPQVESLQKIGNYWGMKKGDFGIADFTVHSYAVETNPKNINELLMALREIPTSNFAKLEQNREDALSLSDPFGALRDFIHDQRPLVREVIQSMVRYHENHNESDLESLLSETGGYLAAQERKDMIFDLTRYDKEVNVLIGNEKGKEKVIDVIKRLQENTQLVNEIPPTTSDAELNSALFVIEKSKNLVSPEDLQGAFDIINGKLEKMMQEKEVGIEPNMILAIAWLERRGYEFLKNLSYEDQDGGYKAPWFHSILKFQELTASAQPFNAEEFDDFISKLSKTEDSENAYLSVTSRTLAHVKGLTNIYSKTTKPHISGALWSGNIAHELIGLTDLKSANTAYGKKHREEQETPLHLRNTGD